MHRDNLAGIHIQKVLQQLVAQVGCRNGQIAYRPENAAHLKGAAVLKSECCRRNGILHRQPTGSQFLPVKIEFRFTIQIENAMHELQPLPAVQRLCLHAQTMEVIEQVILDVVQTGFDLLHALAGHTKGQVFALGQAIVALGQLLPEHLGIFGAHIVKAVFLKRDADAFLELGAVRRRIHKRQLKVDGAVEKVEERAPFLINRRTVLRQGQLIIDVLKFHRPCIIAVFHAAGSVLEHTLHRDGLLCRTGNCTFLPGRFCAVFTGLFPKIHHGTSPPLSESNSSCRFCTGVPSAAGTLPAHNTAAVFRRADRFSGTCPEKMPEA